MVKPVWVWLEENFGDSLPSGFFGCELRESFLKVTCAVPASSFVPDLVTTLTKPDMERPNSAFAPSATTTSSFTAARLKVKGGRGDGDLLRRRGLLGGDGEGLGLPDAEVESLLHDGGEARQLRLDLVRSERQQHGPETPGAVGDGDALVVRGGVLHGDGDARH